MKKLKESIPSNSIKIIELYNKVESEVLETSPDFQRKLVWKKQHKYAFINTILLNYPFPEIYIASSEMDVTTITAKEIVVDGQQRISAIIDYIKGERDFLSTKKVKSFSELSIDEKREFLNYPVSVKDLKDLDMDTIKDIFQKINSTDYSLNTNEKLNAKYGDGEFSMFCKQIVEPDFNPTEDDSDIILEGQKKMILNNFFLKYSIFNDNDRNRMFDRQFVMLLVSTILDGEYFSRSSSIPKYLEKYNIQFLEFQEVLDKLIKVVNIIEQMSFPLGSYWFNKANLFSLMYELSKIDVSRIEIEKLETSLIEVEKKSDMYFTQDDVTGITEDEKKYFEYSRQGSNELQARKHRGKILEELISASLMENIVIDQIEEKNIYKLKISAIPYTNIILTHTALLKNIIDATHNIREFLKENNVHDFNGQELGPDHKVHREISFLNEDKTVIDSKISLYKTGRGDCRLWFSDLNSFAQGNDKLALVLLGGELRLLNISKIDYQNTF